ncbi:MAG: putative Holliday junction resolvase [Syntrophaceae bacterium PtaB.Bin038]|jgi:putative Holliday junction resolvase|nr:MAG: putative Holliday junction resolvase [Syntrophaceae bacterium PtaB.Bin038]
MRILGIDYGEKRIGLALSDELEMTARGLSVIERRSKRSDLEAIAAAVAEHAVGAIVVGYPLRLDGTAGIQCGKVDRFIADVRESIPGVPVTAWDETLSTKQAEGLMREAGVKRKKKRGMVDRIAAAVILQDYLDRKGRRAADGPAGPGDGPS